MQGWKRRSPGTASAGDRRFLYTGKSKIRFCEAHHRFTQKPGRYFATRKIAARVAASTADIRKKAAVVLRGRALPRDA